MNCMGYFTCVMSSVTGNLCNKCPKWLVKQNSSYSDYFNAVSGFTSNSRDNGKKINTLFRQIQKHLTTFENNVDNSLSNIVFSFAYPEIVSLSALIACNAMN